MKTARPLRFPLVAAGWAACGALLAVLGLAALPAQAQQVTYFTSPGNGSAYLVRQIQGEIPVRGPMRLRAHTEVGNIQATGQPGDKVSYTIQVRTPAGPEARARLDSAPVEIRRQGDLISISAGAVATNQITGANISLGVPKAISGTELRSSVGNISARQLQGDLQATSAAGNMSVEGIGGSAKVETSAGNIQLARLTGPVQASTAGGSIALSHAAQGARLTSQGGDLTLDHVRGGAQAITGAGSIRMSDVQGAVAARTGGGNIVLDRITGAVRAETAGGNIRIQGAANVHCESASGNLQLRGIDGAVQATTGGGSIVAEIVAVSPHFGDSRLESSAGDITVLLPPKLAATVEARIESAFGHRVKSDFPRLRRAAQPGRREISVSAPLNGGGPTLQLITNSSDIRIGKNP